MKWSQRLHVTRYSGIIHVMGLLQQRIRRSLVSGLFPVHNTSTLGRIYEYISSWSVPQALFNAAVARFLEAGGAPPKGVAMLGRWHGMDGTGFAISELNDPKAMYLWQAQWLTNPDLTVTPCLEDADAGEVMASLGKR